jgi:excisionase family DNA binding protein
MDRLLKIPEVAQLLGVSRAKTYQLVSRGDLESVRIDGSRRVVESDLVRFVDGLRVRAEAERALREGAGDERR